VYFSALRAEKYTQLIVKYHAAAGEKRSYGYPLVDPKQRSCLTPKSTAFAAFMV
jgi:hypothetical protein